ncbi:hypothetical protein AB0953_07480 [Streptomyces sp. NPDC046866]|uniref:hypothetical protein n=1 Tax=Streptomyces sp. NPDC046866 TaxID=3154921 RepID=UPI0034516569
MHRSRRLTVIAGASLLLLTATACSAGKTTVGELRFRAEDSPIEVTHSNTSVEGCHRILLPRGAAHVHNSTLVDVVLYRTPDCKKSDKADGTYVATTLSNDTAPGSPPWRSFSVIH